MTDRPLPGDLGLVPWSHLSRNRVVVRETDYHLPERERATRSAALDDAGPVRLSPPRPKGRRDFSLDDLAQIKRELRAEMSPPADTQAAAAPVQESPPEPPPRQHEPAPPAPEAVAVPAPAQSSAASSPDELSPQTAPADDAAVRHAGDWLGLFHICRHARCRKAQRCCGEALACLRAGVKLAPESARQLVLHMMQSRELGTDFEEAFAEAEDWHDGYFAWLDGLRVAARRR